MVERHPINKKFLLAQKKHKKMKIQPFLQR